MKGHRLHLLFNVVLIWMLSPINPATGQATAESPPHFLELLFSGWTALAATLAVIAVFYTAAALQFQAWTKTQEVWDEEEFFKSRARILSHLHCEHSIWRKEDHEDAINVIRRADFVSRIAPYFGPVGYWGRNKFLEGLYDPLGKCWILLKVLVDEERDKTGWRTKWNNFEDMGKRAATKLSPKQKAIVLKAAARLKKGMIEQFDQA